MSAIRLETAFDPTPTTQNAYGPAQAVKIGQEIANLSSASLPNVVLIVIANLSNSLSRRCARMMVVDLTGNKQR
jgi:hypothetical protein